MKKKKYQLIIWDWNGTLLNDTDLSIRAINQVLQKYNLPLLNYDSYRELFGFPVEDYYRRIGFNFAQNPFEIVGTEFIDAYNASVKQCSLHRGAQEVMSAFRQNKLQQVVLSARKEAQLQEDLHFYGLIPYLSGFSGLSHHYATSKLENGKALIQELGIDPEQVLLVGDTLHDAEVANGLGCNCVLFTEGHQNAQILAESQKKLIDNLTDLLTLTTL